MPGISLRRFVLLFCLLMFGIAPAQTIRQYIRVANKMFDAGDYTNSALNYKAALAMDSSLIELHYKYAESCRMFLDYKTAEKSYNYVMLKDKTTQFPQAVFWNAMMKKQNGKYKDAKRLFDKYYKKNKKKKDDYYTRKSFIESEACDLAQVILADSIHVDVRHPGENINSVFADFAGFEKNDSLFYFSSVRDDKNNGSTAGNLSRIYLAHKKDSVWSDAKELDTLFNSPLVHNANVTISSDQKQMYFTHCTPKKENPGETICEIFLSEWTESGWGKPVKLDDNINMKGYTSTQPNLGLDEKGNKILYFVSDRPGGQGKLDIWYAPFDKSNKLSKPHNLGPKINSPDNEITPFYHEKSKILFFSSDWYKGIGGFDIFKTSWSDSLKNWKDPINIGFPFNTKANDVYFTMNKTGRYGYFASNRQGAYSIKGETCCNDIYSYRFPGKDSVIMEIKPLDREQELKLLVPLTLYFHNDEPDNNTMNIITTKTYKATYDEYIKMVELYKQQYSSGLKTEDKTKAEQDIADFFEEYVTAGYNDLDKFFQLALKNLREGRKVTVTMKGYCSPLASTEYNVNLAKRRVSSLRNYFNEYQNGAFKPYIVASDSISNLTQGGTIVFGEEDIGELQANPDVSDNPNDVRNSVYSRNAALERKIQIIAVSSKEKKK